MRQRELISSIFLLVIALVISLVSWELPFGSLRSPNMGLFPSILSILLGICSLVLFVQALQGRSKTSSAQAAGQVNTIGWHKVGMTLGGLAAFAFLLEPLGYIVSTFLLLTFLLLVIGAQRWWMAGLVALATSLVSYLLFDLLLGASLPAGILAAVLGL